MNGKAAPMPIAFACPRCGKSYSVDPSLAGRSGKCKACGRPMTVPHFYDDGDDTVATEGYDLSEPLPVAAPGAEAGSVFVPAGLEPHAPPRRRRPASAGVKRSRRDEDDEPFHVRHFGLLVAIPSLLAAGLGLTALIVPNGSLIVACVLAALGGLMILAGYFIGLWAAWREDSLYAFLYLFIPLYTAYYFVTRWDGLRPWFIGMTVGVGLVVVAGLIAEAKLGDKPAAAWIAPSLDAAGRVRDSGPSLCQALDGRWSAIADPARTLDDVPHNP